ncbi:MAG: lanthionine synthetase C family protein [Agriterribacter sp.]
MNRVEFIQNKLFLIREFVIKTSFKHTRVDSPALLSGMSGLVLMMGIMNSYFPDKRLEKKIEECILNVLNQIENSNYLLSNFCNGLAGIAWMFAFLKESKFKAKLNSMFDVESFLNETDERLSATLPAMVKDKDFDLLHGAMGIALYFLERGRNDEVKMVIEAIYDAKIENAQEIMWSRFDKYQTQKDIYDFGLAHGNAGILYFLSKCYSANISKTTCEKLIAGNVSFFLNNIQTNNQVHSFFPFYIAKDDYKSGKNNAFYSRIGWCYGDLGILHSLLLTSIATNNTTLYSTVTQMLIKSCYRRTKEETSLHDSQFCHGTSGVGYLYLSIYKLTATQIFKETSDFWFSEVLKDGVDNNRGVAGYLFEMGENVGWVEMYDLLSGISGVSLSLLAHLQDEKMPMLDKCFFLS